MEVGKKSNALIHETSPYLLQHAHNPVDWHPWGDDAIGKARKENRPIFLSVGYSTCYWCHVMERECFENEAIAGAMNEGFVCIKVDREERPDVDQLYMTAVQLMTRQGGWPMSVFLTPGLRPFFGGTYFPPMDMQDRPGFPRVLAAIAEAFRNRPQEVEGSADQVVNLLKTLSRPKAPAAAMRVDGSMVHRLIGQCTMDYDTVNGGFGAAPKFPRQTLLELLLVHLSQHRDANLLKLATHSLDAMAHGGIRDQLGGGFHRYSTDAQWLVPHFEIMLYDNAMLLWIYAEAHRQTGDARYATVARGIAEFVLREMRSAEGAFFTALDAEVEAREGASYLWTREEVEEALAGKTTADQIERFVRIYGLDGEPNFADPHGSGVAEKSVLHLAEPGTAEDSALLDHGLGRLREILYAARSLRKQPMLDKKVLTSWNALMIRGLAHAGSILGEQRYIQAASVAADYLMEHHRGADGALLRGSMGGVAKQRAFLDDYAFLAQALLDLGDASKQPGRRLQAKQLAEEIKTRFGSGAGGAFFYTDSTATDLIVRQMVGTDSPLPSGNGVAAQVFLELGDQAAAEGPIIAFADHLSRQPEGLGAILQGALKFVGKFGSLDVKAGVADEADRPVSPAEQAQKVLTIRSEWIGSTRLDLRFSVLPGYHINSNNVKEPLTAMRVVVAGPAGRAVDRIDYPREEKRMIGREELGVYEGQLTVTVKFRANQPRGTKVDLAITYQACDDSACLPTVTRNMSVIVS